MTEPITGININGNYFAIGGVVYISTDPYKVGFRILRFYTQGIGGHQITYAVVTRATNDPDLPAGETHVDTRYLQPIGDTVEFVSDVPSHIPDIPTLPTGWKEYQMVARIKRTIDEEAKFKIQAPADWPADDIRNLAWRYYLKNAQSVTASAEITNRSAGSAIVDFDK